MIQRAKTPDGRILAEIEYRDNVGPDHIKAITKSLQQYSGAYEKHMAMKQAGNYQRPAFGKRE